MKGRKTLNYPLLGLVCALVLAGGGLAYRAKVPIERGKPHVSRVVMVGVRGLSWERAVALVKDGRLPYLASVREGGSSVGDIVCTGYSSEDQILASILSGRTPRAVSRSDGGKAVERFPALWDVLASRDVALAVIGFQQSYDLPGKYSFMVPAWRHLVRDARPLRSRRKVSEFPLDDARVVLRDEVADAELTGVAGHRHLEPRVADLVKESLAGDMTMFDLARRTLEHSRTRHLFLFCDGLANLELGLAGDEAMSSDKHEVLNGYYSFLDSQLASLASDDDSTTYILYSENGNNGEPIRYRPEFPELENWPAIGFLFVWGDGVKRGLIPHLVEPVDLAPTALYLAGQAIPTSMDGMILFGLLDEKSIIKKRVSIRL